MEVLRPSTTAGSLDCLRRGGMPTIKRGVDGRDFLIRLELVFIIFTGIITMGLKVKQVCWILRMNRLVQSQLAKT